MHRSVRQSIRPLSTDRISHLETAVENLSAAVENLQGSQSSNLVNEDLQRRDDFPSQNFEQPAPLAVIQHAASDTVVVADTADHNLSEGLDIVSKGIITRTEVESLLEIFQTHYGRWIGLDESKHEPISLDSVKSPLLLSACCLIAVRHSGLQSASSTANTLFLEAKSRLSEGILHTQNSVEFFQATLILSLWSTTLGQKLLSIDSWLITGFALQHALASGVFRATSLTNLNSVREDISNRRLAVWNHLCLAHLHACVSMRRTSLVTKADIDRARQLLQSDYVTNFEVRMVAELHLYFTIYEQCVATDVNLPQAKAALQTWKEEWAFLFNQPRRQFLQTSFFFAGLLIYEQSLSSKSAAVRQSLISDMVRLACDILRLFMDTADERTKHLTDHVYHIVTFAAITLCRLLCRYETQLATKIDIGEMDALVSRTVRWLQAIDTAPHISQIMSTLISNVQARLRPGHNDLTHPELEIQHTESEGTVMPDFLGVDDYFDFDWDAIIPDWQSLDSDDFVSNLLST